MNETNIMDVKEIDAPSDEKFNESSSPDQVLMGKADDREDDPSEDSEKGAADYSYIQDLVQEIGKLPEIEAKVQRVIDFMEQSLAQTGSPHFKSFWQSRGLCLQLFKENIAPAIRSILWTKYTELSKEARRLKDLLDEQSSFAVEQIEIAVKALETDVAQLEQLQVSEISTIEMISQSLKKHQTFYITIQQKLDFLNKLASKINGLRKELIKTEMRVRKKNKFFQRLSQLGDQVFPKRKDLIAELSAKFVEDVDYFISKHFAQANFGESLFFLREEIKALQGSAKLFTLNTHAFTQTRLRLSECWDKVKNEEKERKKIRSEQKTAFKSNMETVAQKLEQAKQIIQQEQLNPTDGNKKIDEVVAFMRTVELGREELHQLRQEIASVRQPLLDQLKTEEEKRQEQEQERQRQKQQKIQEVRREIDQLIKNSNGYDVQKLVAERDAINEKIQSTSMLKVEKLELERLLKPLRDIIADKKAMSLTALSADDKQALEQLKEALQERKTLRQEIKDQLETLRRAKGSSSLDFQRAMECNTQMQIQKERLEKINQAVIEIEQKVADLEKIS